MFISTTSLQTPRVVFRKILAAMLQVIDVNAQKNYQQKLDSVNGSFIDKIK